MTKLKEENDFFEANLNESSKKGKVKPCMLGKWVMISLPPDLSPQTHNYP